MASFRNLLGLPVKDWDNRAAGQVLQLSSDKEHWEFGAGGAEGNGIHIDNRVDTYQDLPSPPTEGTGATYLVDTDGLIYVWDGSAWPDEGEGVAIGGLASDDGDRIKQGSIVAPSAVAGFATASVGGTEYLVPLYLRDPQDPDPHWSKVVSLLHFDADVTDAKLNAWSLASAASIDTVSPLVGAGSFYGVGSGNSYANCTDNSVADFGANDFTIEATIKPSAIPSGSNYWCIVSKRAATHDATFTFYVANGELQFFWNGISEGGSFGPALSVNTTYRVAVCRSGGTIYVFSEGALLGTIPVAGALDTTSGTLKVGAYNNSPSTNSAWRGWIDEVRITKGVARYTSNYTPHTGAFPNFGA